jgi:hypothetical protein
LAIITLEEVPLRAYAPFPELLPFFKCILEIVFCVGVQHRLSVFIFNRGNRTVGWVGDYSHVDFGKKISW